MLNRVEISSIRAVLGAALLFAAVVGALIQPQSPARGQEIMRIAAVVNEETARVTADTTHTGGIADNAAALANEETARVAADDTHTSDIAGKPYPTSSNGHADI